MLALTISVDRYDHFLFGWFKNISLKPIGVEYNINRINCESSLAKNLYAPKNILGAAVA